MCGETRSFSYVIAGLDPVIHAVSFSLDQHGCETSARHGRLRTRSGDRISATQFRVLSRISTYTFIEQISLGRNAIHFLVGAKIGFQTEHQSYQ
ncbi:hypothetical protein BKI51_08255 [Alphaproteobacteria bacterium AO1-B]|nr:hypothetical protein BKI51_08255 [Alphaproteobacteria bacterium AO1-B]